MSALTLRSSVRRVAPADLDPVLGLLGPDEWRELGQALHGRLRPGPGASRLVVSRLRSASPEHLDAAVGVLAGPSLDLMRHRLGPERFEDPSADDLRAVLPVVIGAFGPAVAGVVVAWLVEGDVPAAPVLRTVAPELDAMAPDAPSPGELAQARTGSGEEAEPHPGPGPAGAPPS